MAGAVTSRRDAIIETLSEQGFADIAELRERLSCSEATVRRDLDQLHREGRLRRTHGGAVLSNAAELPFRAKLGEMADAKHRIAMAASRLVKDGEAIGFTGGTTTREVARLLSARRELTVVTNAINIAMDLASSDVRVIVTGGELRGHTFELVGPLAEPTASQIHLDRTFAGVDGITTGGGLTTHHPTEARINRVLIDRAGEVIVVADHTKLGRKTFAQIAPLEVVSTLITDFDADESLTVEFELLGIRVIRT